jgi:uncharacterized membrane protein YhhN
VADITFGLAAKGGRQLSPETGLALNRTLLWLAAICGAIAVLSLMRVLPPWLAFAFKPLTTLLVIAYAWPRGANVPAQRRFIRTGLVLSAVGDTFLLFPTQGFLPGLVAFLLAHLAYIAAFCVPLRLATRRAPFFGYGVIAGGMLWLLWPGIPGALRGAVLAYVICLATMAAQAFAWWRNSAWRPSEDVSLARYAALGGALFMTSDGLLAINKFGAALPLESLWILLTYWLAQWCIASALRSATFP